MLFMVLFSTVPHEYPYYEIAEREVSFIPLPSGTDSAHYERRLNLEFEEDSVTAKVRGIMEERITSAVEVGAGRYCDSVRMEADTVVLFSHLSFGFTRLEAFLVFVDMPLGKRMPAHERQNMYSGEMVLERLGLWQRGAPGRNGSRRAVESVYGTGFALLNPVTGAVISLRLKSSGQKQESPPPFFEGPSTDD